MPSSIWKRPARIACVGVAVSLFAISVSAAPPVLATNVTIDTFPSTGVVLPLVANPAFSPRLIGQSVVVPTGSPVLTQFSLEFAAQVTATNSITVQAVVLPFDATTSSNTGEPIFTSEPVTVTNTTLARITFATGNLSLAPGGTYLIGLTTVFQTQTTTNEGRFGISPNARYPQGTFWSTRFGPPNLTAGQAFAAGPPDEGLTFSATFTSGGGGSSSAPAAALPNFELSLTTSDGTACSRSSVSGTVGTWLALPSANACTPPASKPSAKLLGWATSPGFPVAIAKRQVDNGWGAYETFNSDGQLTGVFIPAGGSTLVSAAGNLYAIWSE